VLTCVLAVLTHTTQVTQDLLQRMLADLFQERPADPVRFMQQWLAAEQQRREERQQQVATAGSDSSS
jgi:hypothetical protein